MKNKIAYIICLVLFSINASFAQLNPLTAQYYTNTYLANPAFAGYNQGLNINASYRAQWTRIPGSPVVQNLTADYGTEKVGIGLNINFDKAGLQRQSRVVGTYAYHLKLNNSDKALHFGLSVGFMQQRLSQQDLVGNINDPLAMNYNQRQTYIDGDFGIGYTSNRFRLEASLPNLNTFTKRDEIRVADVGTFYAAVSYKLDLATGAEGVDLEPKFAYRGIKGMDNMWDFGTQVSLANKQVNLTGMYHSNKSASFGLGLDYRKKLLINGFYTTQTSALTSYSNGSFELNIRGRF